MQKLSLSLPKYDSAMQKLCDDFYDEMHMADKLMKNFPPERVIHSGTIRFLCNPTVLEEPYKNHENIHTGQAEIITQTNIFKFRDFLQDLLTPLLNQSKQQTIDTINQICDTTGNNIEAKNQNVWDAYIQAIEQVEMVFDDCGNPSFLIYPLEIYDKLSQIEPTSEQSVKVEEIFRQKREAHYLKRQSRRLSKSSEKPKSYFLNEKVDVSKLGAVLKLPKYDLAVIQLIREVKNGFEKLDPILGEMGKVSVSHSGKTRQVSEPQILETPMKRYSAVISVEGDCFRNTDTEEFRDALWNFAKETIGQMKKHFFDTFPQICDATGNSIDANGKNYWDSFNEMLETIQMSFDENGNHNYKILVHPNTFKKIQDIPPTEEQLAKGREIIERKKKEYYAQKRTRRLS
jgi:hypothetical protein